jgi:hypothetical protein
VEYRQGVPATITIDLECEMPLHRVWAFSSEGGINVLLSYHNSSAVQHIPNESDEIETGDVGERYGFDTASRTLAAAKDQEICQVTEKSINIIGASQRYSVSPLRCSALVRFLTCAWQNTALVGANSRDAKCHGRECLHQGRVGGFLNHVNTGLDRIPDTYDGQGGSSIDPADS